jgi:FAD:protein FMN transferase
MLGTIVEIAASAPVAAVEAAFGAVLEVQHLMSFHESGSDVARINEARAGHEIVVDPHTHRVLRFARRVSAASGGVFDVTVGDILVRHGFLPASAAGRTLSHRATWRDLEVLAGNRVRWRRAGRIDLGGVAKGYAVDIAVGVLRSQGVRTGLVNAGGDLRMFGEPRPVHVRLPESPGCFALLGSFADCALATSAAYFSSRCNSTGGDLEPLVDPKRGTCASRRDSATVVASECMTADALTKVVRLAPEVAPKVLEAFHAKAMVIDGRQHRVIGTARYDSISPGDTN